MILVQDQPLEGQDFEGGYIENQGTPVAER